METNKAVIDARVRIVLTAAGGEMTAQQFVDEHIRRGWMLPNATPDDMDMLPDDIVRLRIH